MKPLQKMNKAELIKEIQSLQSQLQISSSQINIDSTQYLDLVGVMVVAIDANEKVTLINKKGCEILMVDKNDVIGKNWFDNFIQVKDRNGIRHVFKEIMCGNLEPGEYYENVVLTKDGEERIISWHNRIQRDENGKIIGTLSSGNDITKLKEDEEKIEQQAAELLAVSVLGKEVTRHLTLEQTAKSALREMMKIVKPDIAFFFIRNEEALHLIETYPNESEKYFGEVPVHKVGECICGLAVLEKTPLFSQNINNDHRCTWDECKKAGVTSFAALPLMKHDEAIGVIGLASNEERNFEAESSFLMVLANHVAAALVNSQLYETVSGKTKEWEATFNSISDWITIIDAKTNHIIQSNHSSHAVIGVPYDQVFGEPCHCVVHGGKRPEDCPLVKSKRSGQIETMVFIQNDKWLQVSVEPVRNHDNHISRYVHIVRDISDLKQAEKAIKESESRYRQLVETASDAIYLMDEQGVIIDANITASQMLQKTREKIVGSSISTVDPNFSAKEFVAFWAGAPDEKQQIFETTHITKKGDLIPIEISGKKFKIDKKTYYFGVARDISERKHVEKELREREEKFRTLFENAPIMLGVVDENGNYIDVNDSVHDMLGYTNDFMKSKNSFSFIHADDQEKVLDSFSELKKSGRAEVLYRFKHKSGTYRYVSSKAVKLEEANTYFIYSDDITERKKVEEETLSLKNLLNTAQNLAHLGSWELDLIQNKLIWSDEVFRIFGLLPQEFKATYEAFLERIHPDDRAVVSNAYEKSIKEGYEHYEIDHRIVRKDTGEIRFVHEKCDHEKDESGKIIRSVGMVHDITEQKQAEEKLRISEEKFRNLYENSPFGIVICELIRNNKGKAIDFIHLEANESTSTNTGFTLEDLVGKKASEIVDSKIKTDLVERYQTVVTSHHSISYIQHFDVYNKTLQVTASYLYGDKFIINFIDVTDLKKAEAELYHSLEREQLQANIVRTAPIAIAFGYPDGRLENCNQAFSDLTGYSLEELKTISWNDVLTPEKWKDIEAEKLKDLTPEKNYIRYEKEYVHKSGKIIPIELVVTAKFDDENNIVHFIGFVTDITELKKHREHLEELIKERTLELETKNAQLERMNQLFVGREFRIKELRNKIEKLEKII